MKKTIAMLLVLLVVTGGMVFATGQPEAAKSKVLVMVPKGVHPYYEPCFEGFKDAAAKYGYEAQYEAPATFDVGVQVKTIENLIVRGVAGISISALDDAGLVPVIQDATDAGIKVVTFDAPAPSSAALSYIGTVNEAAGYAAGKEVAKLLGNQGEVAFVQAGFSPNLSQRNDGFAKALAEVAPAMKIVTIGDCKGDMGIGVDQAESILGAYPDLKAIFGISACGAAAGGIVVKEQGKTGKVLVAGFDDLKETLDLVREGVVNFCLVQKTYKMGWISAVKLIEALEGKTIEKEIDTGVIFVTKSNIDTYMADMKKEFQK